ncbi:hypothetical protein Bca4012_075189 [Brassica carinata]
MYPRAASILLVLEESFKDTTYIKPSQSSNVSHEAFLHHFQSLTVVIKLCSHSWTSALISELENFKNKKQISSKQMDDFAEMENEYNKDSSEAAKTFTVETECDISKWIHRIVKIIEGVSLRDERHVSVSQGESERLWVCRKADMKKFAEELSSVLEWMVNHCFSLQNVSSMREEIKKQFEWDESLSGSDVSSLACKDQWIKDGPVNHKLPSKVIEEEAKDKTERYYSMSTKAKWSVLEANLEISSQILFYIDLSQLRFEELYNAEKKVKSSYFDLPAMNVFVTFPQATPASKFPTCTSDYYHFNELLTPKGQAVRKRVRSSWRKKLPHYDRVWEKAEFPFHIIPKLGALGVVGGSIKGCGCPGLSITANAIATAEMSRVDASCGTFNLVHTSLNMLTIGMGVDELEQLELQISKANKIHNGIKDAHDMSNSSVSFLFRFSILLLAGMSLSIIFFVSFFVFYWKMTIVDMEIESADQVSPLPFARSYQVEALEKAMKRNTIVYLETGSGKTLIAIMLLRSYAYLFRKPSPCFSVFLVPQVVLVTQQAEALKRHTDLKVGMYWGSSGVDFWDAPTWKQEVDKYEVLVMTPAILLSALRHSLLTLNMIKVLIFDECHHARGNHAYACILKEFYHKELKSATSSVPRIFGMTASPVKTKGENLDSYWKKIHELESLMNSKVALFSSCVLLVYTCESESVLARFVPFSTPSFKLYQHMEIPSSTRAGIVAELEKLAKEHLLALATLDLKSSTVNSIKKRLSKICSSITYCLDELGILMALKAAQSFSVSQNDFVLWGQQEKFSETSIKSSVLGENTVHHICGTGDSSYGFGILLNEILPTYNSWKTKYVAGNNSGLQSQTRKKQNKTVEDFRKGLVNIIVSTSILEEGLDVQSCNLVVGFDPASTICSFIQSQGRARMPNSDYLMMVESGDMGTRSRLKKYISGAKRMREDSLSHSLVPYQPLPDDSSGEVYRVDSTGAIVTLSSSVSLIYFYCSRLPSDKYFKPTPRFDIDKDQGIAPFTFLRALHQAGALTDHLVPDMVLKETVQQKLGKIHYDTEQPSYFPPELVSQFSALPQTTYHFYSIRMKSEFPGNLHFKDILLGTRVKLEDDIGNTCFRLEDHLGTIAVTLSYVGAFDLAQDEILLCRRFQINLFRVLLDHSVENLMAALDGLHLRDGVALDYLLVPSTHEQKASLIDWERNSGDVTYMEYYEKRHEIRLNFMDEPLLNGRHIFTMHNNLHMTMKKKEKEHDREHVELPPELCYVILAPISVDMIYSYKFMPSVMHRIESLLIALNLKKNIPKVNIPTIKVLEAITTKKCQDQFHLESLETLGDSFLKYAVCQHLFQEYHTHHEGLLSSIKDGMISNVTLCKFGCDQKLQGFIRNECFEPKGWMVPGQSSAAYGLVNDHLSESTNMYIPRIARRKNMYIARRKNMYIARRRNLKRKSVADVVEALIGAYLSEGGELEALTFMNWVGIKVDFTTTMIQREPFIQAEKLVNVSYMESLLNYKFKDKSLLVEALTHGSYMIPEIPRCYQRLEFLGDSVLDYLITKHLYGEYPNLSPGLLTDMRSASVNNECYAQVAVKSNLHKHVLHASHDLHKHISRTVSEFERLSSVQSSFGWESEIAFPKVLGDVIESLAGAIHVDSGYNKEVVFASIKPLLGCMITPETVKLHPVRELTELCQKAQFELSKAKGFENGEAYFTVEVEAEEMSFAHTAKASDKKMAKKLAYKEVLNSLKKSLGS